MMTDDEERELRKSHREVIAEIEDDYMKQLSRLRSRIDELEEARYTEMFFVGSGVFMVTCLLVWIVRGG